MWKFKEINFQVVDVMTERTPNGYSMVYFKAINSDKVRDIMQIKIMNVCLDDNICVRELMEHRYEQELNKIDKKSGLKMGDIL